MKILIVSQYFYPEEFKINDLVVSLIQRGHNVTVLTGKPNYPSGNYFKGYKFLGYQNEFFNGAKVVRVPLINRGNGRSIRLLLNYLSFVFFANVYIRNHVIETDAIICYEISPITQAYPGLKCKKLYGGKFLLWIQDLWPESVTAAGGVNNKIILRILSRMVIGVYKSSDKLLIQSEAFKESILKLGDFKDKVVYVPNWAEDLFCNSNNVDIYKYKELVPEGFKVMFAGNIGASQDFSSIIKAANYTKDITEIQWLIVGDGRMREEVESQVNELGLKNTIKFLGRYPMSEMPNFFVHADAMLVTLRDDYIFSLTIPSKLQSYMAFGKPILSMLNGIGNKIINESQCGLVAPAGDYKALAENVIKMYNMSKYEKLAMGDAARNYYLNNFNKNTVIDRIIDSI